MNTFPELFEVACRSHGVEYVRARDAILEGNFQDDLQRVVAGGKKQERRTAETLLAWRDDRELFLRVERLARGEFSGPATMLGNSPLTRGQAIASLGWDVTPRVIEMLCRSGEADDAQVRSALFVSLGILRDDRAAGPLIELLAGDHSAGLLCGAIDVLCRMRGPAGLERGLQLALDRTRESPVRRAAVYGLGEYKNDPRVASCLLRVLNEELSSVTEKQAAAFALAKIGRVESREGVRRALESPLPEDVRLPLIQTLGRIGNASDSAFLQQLADREPTLAAVAGEAARRIERRSATVS